MIRIRSLLPSVASIACLAILTATSVGAAPMLAPGLSSVTPPGELLLMFDDMGNGTISVGGGSPGSLPGTLIDDPADPACPSTCSAVLTYLLPESVVSGDVAILTPDGSAIADWLRFTDDTGNISGADTGPGGRMIFYFEPPFPSNIGSDNFVNGPSEVITDGVASFDYQPAGVPYPQNNEFICCVVPGVPEPASLVLLGSCLATMGLMVAAHRFGAGGRKRWRQCEAETLCSRTAL